MDFNARIKEDTGGNMKNHDIYSKDIPTGLRGYRKCVDCGKHVDSYSSKERNEKCNKEIKITKEKKDRGAMYIVSRNPFSNKSSFLRREKE